VRRRPRRGRHGRRTSARAWPRSARSARRRSAGAEQLKHLAIVGEASDLLLREDRLAVGDDVVLALRALTCGRVVALLRQLGRETRGPFVVAASDGAVEDLDRHRTDRIRGGRVYAAGCRRARTPASIRLASSGCSCWSCRNSVPKRTRSRDGDVVVTVAVRTPSPRMASSPKKSPGPSVFTSTPSTVTLAVPSLRMKNE